MPPPPFSLPTHPPRPPGSRARVKSLGKTQGTLSGLSTLIHQSRGEKVKGSLKVDATDAEVTMETLLMCMRALLNLSLPPETHRAILDSGTYD